MAGTLATFHDEVTSVTPYAVARSKMAVVRLRGALGVLGLHTLHSTTLLCTSRQVAEIARPRTDKTDTSISLGGREAKCV